MSLSLHAWLVGSGSDRAWPMCGLSWSSNGKVWKRDSPPTNPKPNKTHSTFRADTHAVLTPPYSRKKRKGGSERPVTWFHKVCRELLQTLQIKDLIRKKVQITGLASAAKQEQKCAFCLFFWPKFRAYFYPLFARNRRFGAFKSQFKSFFVERFMNSCPL